jgi:hypothetical protein
MAVTPIPAEVLEAASGFGRVAAPEGLTVLQARLYSHVTRLRGGAPGVRWSDRDTDVVLGDAVRLVEVARTERDAGVTTWQNRSRRAAELLEWLSEPALAGEKSTGLRLLSAAAYQLAGYPAQARGLLERIAAPAPVLHRFLSGEFAQLMEALLSPWSESWEQESPSVDETVSAAVAEETRRCLGILCAQLRWGNEPRLRAAREKLDQVAAVAARSGSAESWLLARLVADLMSIYASASLRSQVEHLLPQVTVSGAIAFERYLRKAFFAERALAWPSQRRGIDRLSSLESFALCTPTGSGKTTVAELAILQSLFRVEGTDLHAPLVMYLTPSRALAAEVEARMSRVLVGLSPTTITVTGLYGGADWGPTDAWMTGDNPTVLICTYEKAEALVRFLGPLFLSRLRLVVVDEAHMVQWTPSGRPQFIESRELRLEALVTRLLAHKGRRRVIALSAVAGGFEDALAQWLVGEADATAVVEPYRSTRQLVGKLEVGQGTSMIQIDMLNGRRLRIEDREDEPYVPNPFPPLPGWSYNPRARDVSMRPITLWAALHMAKAGGERPRPVLIFVPQRPEYLAGTFLDVLEDEWRELAVPEVLVLPATPEDQEIWDRCLAACEDFFGRESFEFRLLGHGIVLHHGKMPASMARLLVEVVERRIANVVVATSTLSEGVNLPFETVLFFHTHRGTTRLEPRAVENTIGRAGRPGHGTEGRALFLMPTDRRDRRRAGYEALLRSLGGGAGTGAREPESPLAGLLNAIYREWSRIAGFGVGPQDFVRWLEMTAPDEEQERGRAALADHLDSLDQILIAVVEEEGRDLAGEELEEVLQGVWRWSYAHHAHEEQERLQRYFVARGTSVPDLYPDQARRRQVYLSSLPPREADRLIEALPELRDRLAAAADYGVWSPEQRMQFLEQLVDGLQVVGLFSPTQPPARSGEKGTFRWWLRAPDAPQPGTPAAISQWFNHVSQSYLYRFCWGIGSVVGLATAEIHGDELRETSLEEWPQTGLPWITLWLKDLVAWGTLDPVAAALLSLRRAGVRADAEEMAQDYYATVPDLTPDDRLNPSRIRDWIEERYPGVIQVSPSVDVTPIPAFPIEFPEELRQAEWRVLPVGRNGRVEWVDPAGYTLARTPLDQVDGELDTTRFDYRLSPRDGRIYRSSSDTPTS